jgi:hypothetical protein
MNIILIIITFISTILSTIKLSIIHMISHIMSFFHKENQNRKIKWRDNLQDIYYTYSKEEYDRKAFRPFIFQRNFFK